MSLPMTNTLYPAPDFNTHRDIAGAPVTAETVNVANNPVQTALNCMGFDKIAGSVVLTGGAAPTVTIQPYQIKRNEAAVESWVKLGAAIGPLNDGEGLEYEAASGRVLLALSAVTGNPTNVRIDVAGTLRARR